MRIIVPIKQVPETSEVKMDPQTGTMIRQGVEAIINPLDLYAIELAVSLRESHGGEVIVISMGPPDALSAIKEAIAMGCDSGVLISDKSFAGSDTWATSYILSAAVRRIGGFGLVICGERATDGDTGQVGPGIAAFLDLPVATYVSRVDRISVDNSGKNKKTCRLHRMVETGYEILDVAMPAVLTVVKEISNPSLPTLDGKLRAKQTEVPVWTSADLETAGDKIGLKGSPTRVVKIFRPKVIRQCKKIFVNDDESMGLAADEFAEFLQQRGGF